MSASGMRSGKGGSWTLSDLSSGSSLTEWNSSSEMWWTERILGSWLSMTGKQCNDYFLCYDFSSVETTTIIIPVPVSHYRSLTTEALTFLNFSRNKQVLPVGTVDEGKMSHSDGCCFFFNWLFASFDRGKVYYTIYIYLILLLPLYNTHKIHNHDLVTIYKNRTFEGRQSTN